ncbi:type I secretion system permease/ATPase [Citrobacter sp. NCU1]|uniref:type I secretion system permease/ATPase n=1 Tax=Citrobacter sp. NCU1 TaxID=2026683 RepID=UPI0013912D7F|nr:type I secretion system permease/ATPase [Citrobacter sp. NCU1]NDO79918.1 type I secretion system permease/ATPase [Citrobacter sp. NCU1]
MNQHTSLVESWLTAMVFVARHYRLDYSEENARVAMQWDKSHAIGSTLENMARQLSLAIHLTAFKPKMLDPWRMPLVVEFSEGQVGVLTKMDNQGNVSIIFDEDNSLESNFSAQEIASRIKRVAILRPLTSIPDARVDNYIKPYRSNWFWKLALRDWSRYFDIFVAALVANVLALAGTLFSMQVYDRVVPAQSEPTLWVLFFGVLLALGFEFMMRIIRVHIADVIGKRADLRISDQVFGHALRIKNSARSKSTGSFISQIRELESVRDLITSTTISTVTDLPFFFLFFAIIWNIGGPLAYVVLTALPLLIIPGIIIQFPLSKLSSEGMRESAIRNAVLVESVQCIEDIKLLRAEQRFQNQWNHSNNVSSSIGMRQRFLTSLLMTWTQEVQSIVYAVVLLVGSFLVIKGDMTTGALVGTSMLASRAIAPLAQISGVLARWQQAKVARKGLDELMRRPVDQEESNKFVHKPLLQGHYQLQDAVFYYDEETKIPDIAISKLNINAGERIAILGKNGAGKSTLLQILSGMQTIQQGELLMDNISMRHLDPADVRRDVGYLNQNAHLFFGSIYENLTMGRPQATDEEIHQALQISGALPFVQRQKNGLNYMIMEGGYGLSGGQRQALLLARTLLCQPEVLLLDEPTAAMDEVCEQHVIDQLTYWLGHRTLIVATHRLALLRMVDRIIVIDNGRVIIDDSKEKVLNQSQLSAAAASNVALRGGKK